MPDSIVQLVVPTTFGLEAVVVRELRALGCEQSKTENGRVAVQTSLDQIARFNLQLRSGERVLLQLGEFDARDFDELFEQTKALPWSDWLPVDAAFPVNGKSTRSQLSHVPSCQSIVKKAVVESLRKTYRRERFPETGAEFPIEFSLLNDRVQVCLNTSGPGLHKRGYRTQGGAAPLKETLAAGLVQLSFWNTDRPFWDPFCGSGTIAIEAALHARQLAPGRNRTFVAESWPCLPESAWPTAREEARDREGQPLETKLVATDSDFRVLRAARDNARAAGVFDDIHFEDKPVANVSSRRKFGCLLGNPPYGERLADETDSLYEEAAATFNRLETWSFFVLTARKDFEQIFRPADRRRKLYNGRIECTYYQFHGPKPPSLHRSP